MEQISPIELKALLQQNSDILLIDVREDDEHAQYNIGGTNIPLSDVIHLSKLIPRNQKVVFYCKRGIRSAIAIQRLEEKFGYTNLVNLQGGLEEWKQRFFY